MIQSQARITSRLCSITTTECPVAMSLRNARNSFAMSSKCRPVVGSSNRKSFPPPFEKGGQGDFIGRREIPQRLRATPFFKGGMFRRSFRRLDQMPRELQPLRLAARERGHRLAELEVFQADAGQRRERRYHLVRQHRLHLRAIGKEGERFGHGQLEHVGHRQRLLAVLACERHPPAPRRGNAARCSRGSAGTRRRGTAFRRARSRCHRRSGSGRCRY